MPESNRHRITQLAIRALEEAVARAHSEPVEPDWGLRLALEWLVQIGVAQRWQAQSFWDEMKADHLTSFDHREAIFVRTTMLHGALDAWYGAIGWERPDEVRRARMERRYAPDLDRDSGTLEHPCVCNRYQPGERQNVRLTFNARELRAFNDGPATVHPKEPGFVVRMVDGSLVLDQMTWGFPVVLKGKLGQPLKPKPVNNARFDKLNGFWRRWAALPEQRCLIPTARFAEAAGRPGHMTETWLSLKEQPIFAWAGLWSHSSEWGDVYTGVMTENAPELADIHDRSPVILDPADWQAWLTEPLDTLRRFDRPYPADRISVEATSKLWASKDKERPA